MSSSDIETKPLIDKKVKKKSSSESPNESLFEKVYLVPIFVCVIIVIFLVYLKISSIEVRPNGTVEESTTVRHNDSWKFLLFTQQWMISFCSIWTEQEQLPVDSCHFGKNKYAWTVHGIWPTTNNTAYPQYCRKIPFNESAIEPIENDLNEHWSTIQNNNGTPFWRHEWLKHGTCSVQIPQLDSELKYFEQGLEWNQQFNISDAFQSCQIYPDDSKLYQSTQVVQCLEQYFGVAPQIYCERDPARDEDIIVEIRFCVNKELQFVGCDTYNLDTLCKENLIYPATVLPKAKNTQD